MCVLIGMETRRFGVRIVLTQRQQRKSRSLKPLPTPFLPRRRSISVFDGACCIRKMFITDPVHTALTLVYISKSLAFLHLSSLPQVALSSSRSCHFPFFVDCYQMVWKLLLLLCEILHSLCRNIYVK